MTIIRLNWRMTHNSSFKESTESITYFWLCVLLSRTVRFLVKSHLKCRRCTLTECLSAMTVRCEGHWMLHICSWFKHGCLLTSLTNQFMLDISQLARLMLMLRVKCFEEWLYLDVFIAVFLHLLPSWDLSPRWWWLTQIYSALLLSAPSSPSTSESRRPRWVPSLGFLTQWTLTQ